LKIQVFFQRIIPSCASYVDLSNFMAKVVKFEILPRIGREGKMDRMLDYGISKLFSQQCQKCPF